MAKKKKLHIKWPIYLIIVIIVILLGWLILKPKAIEDKKDLMMIDLKDKTVEEIKEYSKTQKLELIIKEENSETIEKGKIINQSIKPNTKLEKNQKLEVIISLGKIDKEIYKQKKVDESGNIPIMMYHGIHNKKNSETGYTGGNVDKAGYNRTAEAFIEDLETYYEKGYRLIRLQDYIDGNIDVELGFSPIILTFDDGSENNFKVIGKDDEGNLKFDPNSAIGILEAFKKKHKDATVTATFFLNRGLCNQLQYNEEIIKWLIKNGYDVGNHSATHANFTQISETKSVEEIGKIYNQLDKIIPNEYVKIVALPFGTPYSDTHKNFKHIVSGTYDGKKYETEATLRVGWESDYSPFNTNFNKQFLKRIRAYDNKGLEFDIEMNLKLLESKRYISDGNKNTIVVPISKQKNIKNINNLKVITYE